MGLKNEKIVETKSCQQCQISFDITDRDLIFYKQVSPVFDEVKYDIPTPRLCSACRQQRRLSWRNERSLYKRKCDATGKDIISIYSPENTCKVYSHDIWFSDHYSALDYGQDFNFEKSFADQFKQLQKQVPRLGILSANSENSGYTNHTYHQKNCYLVFEGGYNEDSMYSTTLWDSKDCVDCEIVHDSHNCYQSQHIKNCQNCYFSMRLQDCHNCIDCSDCINCKDCFGSSNQLNGQYIALNKQYTKEAYEDFMKNLGSERFTKQSPQDNIVKALNIVNCENSTGDNLTNCKDCEAAYDSNDLENVKYSWKLFSSKNCYDYDIFWENSENVYEVHCSGRSYNVAFSNIIWEESKDIYYSDNCVNGCSNLFGCIWLKNNQYCIFNKQYSESEYNELVPKIIEHMRTTWEWWEFFPSSISPFGYNETVAAEYFPLDKPNAIKKWFVWSDYEVAFPKVEKTIAGAKLPNDIADVPDDILNWAIECEVTKKPFRIITQELEFYRRHGLPIPRRHPDQRHIDRMKLRNKTEIHDSKCHKCSKDIQTSYSPESSQALYCESCYNKEIY